MKEQALVSRAGQADNKSFKEFNGSLEKAVKEMRAEVESADLDVFDMKSQEGAEAFFKNIESMLARTPQG